jgi:hypothetical protein
MVKVSMRHHYGLKLQRETIDSSRNAFSFITRIDTDSESGFLAADDASVLLKGGDGYFFDNHCGGNYDDWPKVWPEYMLSLEV